MAGPHNVETTRAGESAEPLASERILTCPHHGNYTQSLALGRYLGVCHGCTDDLARRREGAAREQAEQTAAAHMAGLLQEAGIQGRFHAATLDSFRASTAAQRQVMAGCRDFAETVSPDTGAGLFLIGQPGTGKTHLCAAMVRRYVERTLKPAGIVTARDLIRDLRATWRRDAQEGEEDVIQRYGAGLHLLALDEVGASFGTEAEQVQLLDIIDLRYRLQRPTIVASNLPMPDLKTALGERAFDRLREGAKVLTLTWSSHRGKT